MQTMRNFNIFEMASPHPGSAPHWWLPEASAAQSLGDGLLVGGAGEEDEGHLPHP